MAPSPDAESVPAITFRKNISRLAVFLQTQPRPITLPDGLAETDPGGSEALIEELNKRIAATLTIITWAIPMLVTFTESYLQDALALIVENSFKPSELRRPIVEEISGKWIKNTIRSGNPYQWINQLEKFGASGYPEDLANRLQSIWNLRHRIIHSSEPNITTAKDIGLSEALKTVGEFVKATDALVIAHSS